MKYIMLELLALASLFGVGQAPPDKKIFGLLNRSLELPTGINIPVKEVIWKYRNPNNGKTWHIAKIQNGSLISRLDDRYNPDSNGRVLVLNRLTKDDNGVYIVEVTLPNGTVVTQTFYVIVQDPIPPVQITQEERRIGNQWNVSLQCSVASNTSDLSYTWLYRYLNSSYQSTTNTGSIMQIVLPLDHQGMEYMCIVQNRVDQNNASGHIEPRSGKMEKRKHVYLIIPAILMTAIFGAILWKYWKRSSARSGRGGQNETLKPPVQDTETQESLFIDIPRGKIGMKNEKADEEEWMKSRESGEARMTSSVRRIQPCSEVELVVHNSGTASVN